ncbi:MAG: macro domain-containing protein, partial [Pseudonocardiaceae bacterium]
MIHESHGNLLDSDAEALVNTVNTVGVMGKGIALQFRRRFPDMFRAYERAAKRREVRLGQMHVWDTGAMTGPRFVINFPTKDHWRALPTSGHRGRTRRPGAGGAREVDQ